MTVAALAAALSACTTAGLDMAAELEAVKVEYTLPDPDLPETMTAVPAARPTPAVETVAAVAGAPAEAAPEPAAAETAAVAAAPELAMAAADPAAAESAAQPAAAESAVIQAAAPAEAVDPLPGVAQARAAAAGQTVAMLTPQAPIGASAFAGSTPRGGAIAPAALRAGPRQVAARSPELDALIARYAAHYDVPVSLVRRVVQRESTFNPAARNGPYWGLMQIRHDTARSMGYQGPPEGLLDAETNLNYAVRYLRGAYITAGGNHDMAVRHYARGYYYAARDQGLLEETGLGRDRRRRR